MLVLNNCIINQDSQSLDGNFVPINSSSNFCDIQLILRKLY